MHQRVIDGFHAAGLEAQGAVVVVDGAGRNDLAHLVGERDAVNQLVVGEMLPQAGVAEEESVAVVLEEADGVADVVHGQDTVRAAAGGVRRHRGDGGVVTDGAEPELEVAVLQRGGAEVQEALLRPGMVEHGGFVVTVGEDRHLHHAVDDLHLVVGGGGVIGDGGLQGVVDALLKFHLDDEALCRVGHAGDSRLAEMLGRELAQRVGEGGVRLAAQVGHGEGDGGEGVGPHGVGDVLVAVVDADRRVEDPAGSVDVGRHRVGLGTGD